MIEIEIPLSIVITTYNRPKILERCLKSIQEQSYSNIEIIVVDDHSIPSYEKDIRRKFPEIKYVYQEKNSGPGPARNRGIELAKNN